MNTNKAQILPNEKPTTGEKLVVLTSIITNLPGAFAAAVFPFFAIDMTNIVGIFFLTVVSLALSSAALADNHGGLAARGYR